MTLFLYETIKYIIKIIISGYLFQLFLFVEIPLLYLK